MRLRSLALLGSLILPATGEAQITVFESDGTRLGLTGYVTAFSGIHDRGFDIPVLSPENGDVRVNGVHSQVARAKWQLEGDRWKIDVHNRLQATITSAAGGGPVLGFGVSTVPDRLLDLETGIVDEPGTRVWHDVDRLSFTARTPITDVTLGRQPITWGVSALFPVADLWTRFSPFELDTEEKPGIDAVRALFYPVERLEMDAVVAHRGGWDDLSFGLRGTYGMSRADVWVGAGKLWRQAMAMGGITFLLDETRLRAEAVLPYDLDAGSIERPRATLGVDWIRGTLLLTGEYHYNGVGATAPERYTRVLQDPRFTRGETYYLGRHYLGGTISGSPDLENRLTLSLTALANARDPSLALTPFLGYDLGQATRVGLGALVSLGETPAVDRFPPSLRSEFGTYGDLLFTRVSIYF